MSALIREAPRSPGRERRASEQLLWASAMIGAGGLLLGLQRVADGSFMGTGFQSLGMGALIALLPMLFALAGASPQAPVLNVPRDGLSALSALFGYAGLAFVAAGVLLPGGPWMFVEGLLLLFLLSRRSRAGEIAGLAVSRGIVLWVALLLLLRLWVTYQGCRNQWSAIRIDVPYLSALPWLPDWLRTLSLGDFTAAEFGIPEIGLAYAHTVALWGVGLALCVGGLWWRHRAAHEYENDRIHATIHLLSPQLASLVEKLLPEELWRDLGLHGLTERQRKKRLVALTEDRILRQLEFNRLFAATRPELPPPDPGFSFELHRVFKSYDPPSLPPREARVEPD